ncbi:MAG TPA: TetR family transcriptional regulator [Usitatibacter sp.]|jgi:AcrR family transcriptional regulator|nr:TetR family transcriptional regulator [Usitatibacter sp.]
MPKQRAIASEDREARRHAILDAAEKLFLKHPERMASVSEVAAAAGLAKGTVYLYFPSKEEMLLALHERHVGSFFAQLIKKVVQPGPVGFDDVFGVTRDFLISLPGYLELTSRCFALMDRAIPREAALAFKARVAATLSAAGVHLERHFALAPGDGVTLLLHSYGLLVGLWQLLHPNERFGRAMRRPELKVLDRDYEREVERALRALWGGWTRPDTKRKTR